MDAPVQSMTGFGRLRSQEAGWDHTWEVRTVNSRYLEIKWRIPPSCRRLEGEWDKLVRTYLTRGRADISLDMRLLTPEAAGPTLDKAQALGMIDQLRLLADTSGRPYHPDLNFLVLVPFLWRDSIGDLSEDLVSSLSQGLRLAIEDLCRSRVREGRVLVADITARLERMTSIAAHIRSLSTELAPNRMESLHEKVNALLLPHEKCVDDARLLQELAFLADRLDVSEELTRLDEHLREARRILAKAPDPGRRLDFLFQECLREITTCGNKTQDAFISHQVVEFKTELEKCREQVQNLE
ncbi:MAG TPA: YicC family protein [Desulfonatronum sp.]|nr:YicC family protein [Desulfonatronum sp.]